MPQRWIGSILRVWGVISRLYFWATIVSLLLAFASIGIYYVLPLEMRSQLLLAGVLPLFLLLPVTAILILGVFLIVIVSLIAQRTIITAVKRRGHISLDDLTMETGIRRQDLLPVLEDLARKKKIIFVTTNEISYESEHSET